MSLDDDPTPILGTMTEPTPEHPSAAQLQAYGDFAFLYLRSDHHRNVSLSQARLALQPAIDLMQYHVFRFEGVPRFGLTWAFLNEDTERKIVTGEQLQPADWRSGDRMWVIEIIAPYGQGTAAEVVRWLKRSLPKQINTVRYMRVQEDHRFEKVIEVRRISGAQWGTRTVKVSDFVKD